MPIRIQRKRSRGWKMPPNTVYVGRPSRYGNPYHVIDIGDDCYSVFYNSNDLSLLIAFAIPKEMAYKLAVERYKEGIRGQKGLIKKLLAGKNLSCFCPLDIPCHADVLLKIANQ